MHGRSSDWGMGLILPGWRWVCEPQVGVSTPYWAVSTLGTTIFVPGLLELYMYGIISDPGIEPYLVQVALALPTPG